jgi:small-conductance mechanosensitive channel
MSLIHDIFMPFWHLLTQPLFEINSSKITVLKIVFSVLIFVFGFYVGAFYKTNIKKVTQNISSINSTTRTIFSNLGYYAIIVIAFLLALNVLGINLSSIGLVAGALSVGIGFGLQNIVSNFMSGIILMFERSIKIGDYIELSEDLKGHVTGINMRSTTINTNSNIDVIVPNQNFIQNNVINWSMNDEIRRFQMPFGVAYGTKPELVIDVIKEAVKNSGFEDIVDTPSRHTRVIMTGMGNSSVDFELFVWLKGSETFYPKRTTSRFLILIYNALYENNIEIPFPQQDLHIKSVDDSLDFQLKIDKTKSL